MPLRAREELTDIDWLCATCGREGFEALEQYLRNGAEVYGGAVAATAEALLHSSFGAQHLMSAYRGVRLTLAERLPTGSWRTHSGPSSPQGDVHESDLLSHLSELRLISPLDRAWVGHKGGIWGCDVSPDGQHVLSASGDKSIAMWSMDDGTLLARTDAGHGEGRDCAFTPDGRWAISVHDAEKVMLWDGMTMAPVASFDVPLSQPYYEMALGRRWRRFAVSPDGTKLAIAGWDTISVWSLNSFAHLRTVRAHDASAAMFALFFASDEQIVAALCGDPSRLVTVDLSSGEIAAVAPLPGLNPETATVTADQKYLVAAAGNGLAVWKLDPPCLAFRSPDGIAGGALAVSPDARLVATADATGLLRLWSFPRLQELHRWDVRRDLGCRDIVCALTFTPQGDHLIAAGSEGVLRRIMLPDLR